MRSVGGHLLDVAANGNDDAIHVSRKAGDIVNGLVRAFLYIADVRLNLLYKTAALLHQLAHVERLLGGKCAVRRALRRMLSAFFDVDKLVPHHSFRLNGRHRIFTHNGVKLLVHFKSETKPAGRLFGNIDGGSS